MSFIEVIIPTMWRSDKIYSMLSRYNACPHVTCIHLIDNGLEYPKHRQDGHTKIKVHSPARVNQYFVNPAWNLGARRADPNSLLCIVNDDITFDTLIFPWMLKSMNGYGIVGLGEDCFLHKNPMVSFAPSITETKHHTYGFGCMMFIRKKDYREIPAEFRVFYGDTFLLEKIGLRGGILKGLPVDASMHATTSSIKGLEKINKQEIEAWKKLT